MDQRKKNLRAVQLSHLINEYFADSIEHPVRVSADRVPTLSLVPNNSQMEPSKVVLNKHGWNPVLKPYTEPVQKAGYIGEVPRPRSVLREPNENHHAEHVDSRHAAQLPEGYKVSSSVSSSDYITRMKDIQPERNHSTSVTNGHNIRTSQINTQTNDTVRALAPRYDNSQYVGRKTDTANVVGHLHDHSPPLSPGRTASSHARKLLKYDDSSRNFCRNDDKPIISAYPLPSSVKGSHLTVRDRDLSDFSDDKQTRGERINPEGTAIESSDMLKHTKLGMKVRQHKDLNGQDGLEKLRQIIARQRHGKQAGGTERRAIEPSNWNGSAYPTSIPPFETAGLHPCSSVTGATGKTSDAGPGVCLSNDSHSIANRSLHRSDDPVRPSKRTRHEPRPVGIPRKVAQAPAPPSYRGFSEIVSHKPSTASDTDRQLIADASKKRGPDQPVLEPAASSRPGALAGVSRVEVQASNQTAGITIQDARPKKLVQFDKDLADKTTGRESSKKLVSPLKNAHVEPAFHKKLTKPNKSDINVRSWRAGIEVVKQELGKLPKMSLSPPTKDSSPEQHLDDFSTALPPDSLARSESDDIHNRIVERHEYNRFENKIQDKRGGAMETVNNRERNGIDVDHYAEKGDISDQFTQISDETHEQQDQDMDKAHNKNDEDDRSIRHEHHAEVKLPTKSKPLSLRRRIQKPPEPEKEKDRKISRDISYDKTEVKLYMAKQKAERKRKEKEEQLEKQRAEENRQRQLEELSKKQKESARLRSRPARSNKGKPRTGSRENSTDSGGHLHGDMSSVEVSSTEERSCERIQLHNSQKGSDKMNRARFDQDNSESGAERKYDFNSRELQAKTSDLTQNSATEHSSNARMNGLEAKNGIPKETKNGSSSSFDSKKNLHPYVVSSVTTDSVSWRQPSAHVTSSAVDSVSSRPGADSSRNFEERWATLAQSAQSLQSRMNDQANSFATALNSRVSLNKPAILAPDKSQTSSVLQPPRNVWIPTDSASVQTAIVLLSNGYADNVDEESDSTLTEDSVAQLEKPSLLHPMKFTGTDVAATGPISHRKNSDIDRWITKRERKDSDMESTITGSMMSDTESEGKASMANSTAAVLPVHMTELSVDTGRDSDYMLKLKTMQQAHRAAMLSLQAKSQQELILASRRPLTQKTEMDSLRFTASTLDSQFSFFPGAAIQSSSVLHLQNKHLPGSQFSVEKFSGKQRALESNKEQEPSIHYRSSSKASRSVLPSHQPQATASFSGITKRDRSQPEKGLDGSFDLDSSITEEEMERSLREVLPSERQRKRLRRDASLTTLADQNSAKHVFESESFDTFSLNLVRDYLTQEQSRIQHQHSLLKLREQALADKTRAELAWLEQQKQKTRKGCDDSYPAIRQKQKEVLEKHKKEETGLRILQDFTKQAMKMQQGSMTEIEKITLMQQTALQIKQELDRQNPRVRRWLDANELTLSMLSSDSESAASVTSGGKQLSERLKEAGVGLEDIAVPLNDARNEDTRNLKYATTETSRSPSPQRDNSVGLEVTVDASVSDLNLLQSTSPMQEKIAHKLKMQLDKKYLTVREQKLRQRRMEAERLLAWKNRLDREEEEVVQLEMEAGRKLPQKRNASVGDGHDVMPQDTFGSALGSVHYKDCCTSPFHPSPIPSTEELHQGHPEHSLPHVTPPLKQEDLDMSKPTEEAITGVKDVVAHTKCDVARLGVRSNDSVDGAFLPNTHKVLSPEVEELRTSDLSELSNHRRRSSASETEESISIPISELTSDQSDIERQVRALQEELLRKKIEVENLRKRKKKEKLKAKEDCLKKKIEMVNEEIEKLATTSPTSFKELASAEQSLVSPPALLESSVHASKVSPDGRGDVSGEASLAAVGIEVSEKHDHVMETPQRTDILVSTRKNDDDIRPKGKDISENSTESNTGAHKPVDSSNFPAAKSLAVASEVNEETVAGMSGNSPALDITDLDDFFDVDVNSTSSRGLFKATEENLTKVGTVKDQQDERDGGESEELSLSFADGEKEDEGERLEKSASSFASKDSLDSVSNRSHSPVSAKSDVKKETSMLREENLLNNENVDDASLSSEKSAKSISFVDSKSSRPSLSEKSHSVVSTKSDNKIKAKETTDLHDDKNMEGESLASDKSSRSPLSMASDKSQPPLSERSHSVISTKSKSDDDVGQKVLEQTVDKTDGESEKSAESAHSSRRSLSKSSNHSKKSHDSKITAPSSSSNVRSYAEDFSAGSRQASGKNASEHAASVEDDHTVCRSDAEEVKTEDDISSSLSEDGELEDEDQPSRFRLDLTSQQVATSEICLEPVSSEKTKDFSKDSPKSTEEPNDVSRNASIMAEDGKDASKTSSEDNLMKERLPEFPSETDIQNESADQTSPSGGDSRLDTEERSLSGAGDSELERVISSAAAAVELFEEHSPSSVVPNDVTSSAVTKGTNADVLADKTVTGLVSEAISEVLAIKAKKETSSSVDNDSDLSFGAGQETEQKLRTQPSSSIYDNWGDDGEFLDDDFGWPPAERTPPPPPYTEGPKDDLGSQKQPTSLRLPGLIVHPPEPAMVVPHTADELLPLADQVVDIFWHLRRCGESWDDVQPTSEYFGLDANSVTVESSSRRMYKQLIFEVVAEFLRDMYRDEEDNSDLYPLVPPRPTKWKKYYKEQEPPKTLDVLKPVVQLHVMHTVGQQVALQKVPRKWSTRRKDDGVDRVLVKELHEEEPEWVSYESDTVNIKMQLSEAIFQLLLADTARSLRNVQQRIAVHQLPEF